MRSSPGGTRSSAKSQAVGGGGVGTEVAVSDGPVTASRPGAGDVRADLVGRLGAVRLAEPLEEARLAQDVLLGADRLDDVGGEHRAQLGAAPHRETGREPREEPGPERVPDTRRVCLADLTGDADLDRLLAADAYRDAVLASGLDLHPDALGELVLAPAGLLAGQVALVLVGEEVLGPVDEARDRGSVTEGQLLGGGGGEGDAA